MRKINVLSLFDGISCGQLALKKCNIKINKYYASEIDKDAIKVTQHHFSNTIQLGDVENININNLQKIDLLIGGSPCQGFSYAGNRLNFNDERSKLFFEFVRIKNEIEKTNSNLLFLLENVVMKREYQNIISRYLDIEPILINSKLVSAQNRPRLYWTNINYYTSNFARKNKKRTRFTCIKQPNDQKIYFKDIKEDDKNINKYYLWSNNKMKKFVKREYKWKSTYKIIIDSSNFRTIDTKMDRQINQTFYNIKKVPTIMSTLGSDAPKVLYKNKLIRYLTCLEIERAQTLPDNYTSILKDYKKRWKCIGNCWTIEVIMHIFKYLKNHKYIINSILRR